MHVPNKTKIKGLYIFFFLIGGIALHNQKLSITDPENTYPKLIRRTLRLFINQPQNELEKHLIGKGIICKNRAKLYHQIASATVLIEAGEAIGAGVFISPKVIATAAHVVNNLKINVFTSKIINEALAEPGKNIPIQKVHRIQNIDLAFVITKTAGPNWLQLEQNFTNDTNLMIVGHPKRKYYSLQKARIKKKELIESSNYIFFKDNEVFFGNSGGAIVGCNGHLVGIVSMMQNYENSYFKQGIGINSYALAAYAKRLNIL